MSEYKLVPVEPTLEMEDALLDALGVQAEPYQAKCLSALRAAISAAPSPAQLSPAEAMRQLREAVGHAFDGVDAMEFVRAERGSAPSPEWVKTSDRLPTREDADEWGHVWVVTQYGVCTDHWGNGSFHSYWMPKPRATPPKPPEGK